MAVDPRFALLFSDGSLGVLRREATFDDAIREAAMDDPREDDPAKRAKLVKIDFQIIEHIVDSVRTLHSNASAEAAALITKAKLLNCDDQHALAEAIAANVGYVLAPEPKIDA